ncbi:hypothetical protein AVEN_54692-1 [Araneus ventricosus]|uniref:Uncharacterized protein n=1 Tax=Araneus ventricosus TaxID=182803 RepID=A0A4Y2L779_ARAVE|nr:hypothetical protein AVEN_54692-1 [Araneus ventricosus]
MSSARSTKQSSRNQRQERNIPNSSVEPLFRSGSARMRSSANIYNGHRNKASGYPDTKSRPEPCKELGLRVERRHHLQSVCLQDVVLLDQTDENRLGLSLVGQCYSIHLTAQT